MHAQHNDPFDTDYISKQLMQVKDPALTYEEKLAFKKRKYDELMQKISFLDNHLKPEERRFEYPDDFRPFVFFFKFLARRPDAEPPGNINRLKLWLPDTILTAEGDNPPMWLYTSQEGYVHRTDNFSAKSITNKLGSFASPDELVAVIKKPQIREFVLSGNDIRLLTLKDLSAVGPSILSNKGDMVCLQRFIKSNGPKAFICRTCWRRDRNPYVWVITSNKDFYSKNDKIPENQRYITNPRVMDSCTILNSIRGRYVEETVPYIVNLVKYIEHNIPGARFEEFVADFVKDESGTWWLINVKGFVLVDKLNVNPKPFLAPPEEVEAPTTARSRRPEGYQKVGTCKYCEATYNLDELQHKMTLKSIIQTDKHLLHRGKTFKWLERSEIKQIDTAALYQEHKVCKSCYKLHQEIEKLRQVEFELAKAVGIPVNEDKRPDLVSAVGFSAASDLSVTSPTPHDQPNLAISQLQSSTSNSASPMPLLAGRIMSKSTFSKASLDSPRNSTKQSTKIIKRYRLMLYLHMLYDVPKDIDAGKQYYLEYIVLDQRQKYRVELNNAFSINGDILIPVNKLRVFYLFSNGRNGVNDFINEQKAITFNLFCDNERIGTSDFELGDFLSDNVIKREIFKVFSGKTLPILSWGLKVTMGIVESGTEDITRVKLLEHRNVYITYPEYYSSEPLPEEWIQTYEETHHHLMKIILRSELKSSTYSMNVSTQDLTRRHHKNSFARSSNNNTPLKMFSERGELGQSPGMPQPQSAQRLLFNDDNRSPIQPTEPGENDENRRVLKKILTDSIRDYERKGFPPARNKSASARKKVRRSNGAESGSMSARTWGAPVKQMK